MSLPLFSPGNPHPGSDTFEPELLNDRTFYDRFREDLHAAKKQVVIWSPFVSSRRVNQLTQEFSELNRAGVSVTAIISSEVSYGSSKEKEKEKGKAIECLKRAGVRLREAAGMHEKFVFIDDEIIYTGSLNILSHMGTTEYMERIQSPRFVKKLKLFTRTDKLVEMLTYGPDIEVCFDELPPVIRCQECQGELNSIYGKYGPFYGHKGYRCGHTEDVSEEQLRRIPRLTAICCSKCGNPMQIKVNRKDAWLVCNTMPLCDYGQRIVYKSPKKF